MVQKGLRRANFEESWGIEGAIDNDNPLELQQILDDKGIDPDAPLPYRKWRPLHVAAENGNIQCAALLISKYKADLCITDAIF